MDVKTTTGTPISTSTPKFKEPRTSESKMKGMTSLATLITGGGAGLAEGLVCHPLDTIKVRMQLQRRLQGFTRPGLFNTGHQIIKSDSVLALYRGLMPVLLGIVPKMAVRFTSFEAYKSMLSESKSGQLADRKLLLAALAAGITEAVLIVTPMDVIKIRLQAQHLTVAPEILKQGRFSSIFQSIRREGFLTLYSGVGLTALRQGTNQAANLFTYTKLTSLLHDWQPEYRNSRLPIYQVTIIGLIAGSIGPLCNAPIDTIKTRVQQGPRPPGRSTAGHLLAVSREIIQRDGMSGMYRGVLPRIMRVGLGQAVTFPVYELLKQAVGS